MKFFVFSLTLALAQTLIAAPKAEAREALLADIVKPVQQRYASIGRDTNSVSATYYDSHFKSQKDAVLDALDFFGVDARQVQPLKNESSIMRAFSRCVFYTKGAYGKHISDAQSEQLAKSLLKNLQSQTILTPEMYLVNRVPVDPIGSGCGVVLFSTLNNEFVFLTAEGRLSRN